MSYSLQEKKIMFAFYLCENIQSKVVSSTRPAIQNYLDRLKNSSLPNTIDRSRQVSSKTIQDVMVSVTGNNKALTNTKTETLEKIADLFACEHKTIDSFYSKIGFTKKATPYVKSMKAYFSANVPQPSKKEKTQSISLRAHTFPGKWEGVSFEVKGDFPLTITLRKNGSDKHLRGEGSIVYDVEEKPVNRDQILLFEGEILDHPDFVRLHYKNSSKDKVQFGTIYFKLSDDGQVLDGNFVGYGWWSKDSMVTGRIKLEKVHVVEMQA